MPAPIPVRFNASAVARYETIIRQLCHSWPQPILVNPAPLSVETFRCRFRDAMRGVAEFGQGSQELQSLLQALQEPVVLSEFSGMLRIGPKSASRVGLLSAPQAGQLISQAGILSGAKVAGVTEKFIWDSLPPDYEGGVVENEDGSFNIY